MKYETLKKLDELLCYQLDDFAKRDKINSSGELQIIDTTLHAAKNLYKLMDEAEGESSYRMDGGNSRRYSRRGGSYRMSYDDGSYRDGGSYDDGMPYDDGGSYRRGRDRMGRFVSRSGDMIDRLKDMRDETDDPTERKEFDAFIKSIERRG